jgi:hypothetical protein
MTDPTPAPVTFELLGGPTAVIRIGALTLRTDPTFDAPGDYPAPSGTLVKTRRAAKSPDELGPVDVVLLSHDQHPGLVRACSIEVTSADIAELEALADAANVNTCAGWEREM